MIFNKQSVILCNNQKLICLIVLDPASRPGGQATFCGAQSGDGEIVSAGGRPGG